MSGDDLGERGTRDLIGDLLRAVAGLGRNTARMVRFEARDVVRRLGRRVALLIASSVVAAAGVMLVLGGLASLLERALEMPLWAALLVVGAAAVCAGVCGVRAALRRLGDADLAFPETVAELTKDVELFTAPRERGP